MLVNWRVVFSFHNVSRSHEDYSIFLLTCTWEWYGDNSLVKVAVIHVMRVKEAWEILILDHNGIRIAVMRTGSCRFIKLHIQTSKFIQKWNSPGEHVRVGLDELEAWSQRSKNFFMHNSFGLMYSKLSQWGQLVPRPWAALPSRSTISSR